MANNNPNNNNKFDDPSFQTQKLSKDTPNTPSADEMFERAKPKTTGTEDKRVKAMEEAVKRAKTKNPVTGVSTEDDYSGQETAKSAPSDQKVVNTVKLKRVKAQPEDQAENVPDSTLKIRHTTGDEEGDEDEEGSTLSWQYWILLFAALGIAGVVVYLLLSA